MDPLVRIVEVTIAALAALGFLTIMGSRSLLKMLIGVEMLFNAALLYLLLIGTITPLLSSIYGFIIVVLATAEVIVAVSIGVLYYRMYKSVEPLGEGDPLDEA